MTTDKVHADALRLVDAMKREVATMDDTINSVSCIRAAAWLLSAAMALDPNATPKWVMDTVVLEIDAVFKLKIDLMEAELEKRDATSH